MQPLNNLIKQKMFYALNHLPTLKSCEREVFLFGGSEKLGSFCQRSEQLHISEKRKAE